LYWDYYIDWGFLRSRKSGTYGLRDKPEKHKYPIYFYYWAMVSNAGLRFFWLIGSFYFSFEDDQEAIMNKYATLTMISMLAEGLRRFQWALIRVENEFFNNYEVFRTITTIPGLMGKIEKVNKEKV